MDNYLVALGSSIWLGILTSISPCPLATNIAAITYIGKRVDRPAMVLWSGVVYTIGRMITYVVISMLVVASMLSIPDIAMFLQNSMNKLLGPILILAGIMLLGLLKLKLPGGGISHKLQGRVEKWGIWGAGLLGLLFALSFCPVSAALFFGSLIPLALDHQSSVIIPTVFGIGTALPVAGFALLIAFGTRSVGVAFDRVAVFARWARWLTGVAFIVVGIYYVLIYLVGVQLWNI